VDPAPVAPPGAAADAAILYGTRKPKRPRRYEGSRRWLRGRTMRALAALPPGASLRLDDLGRQLFPDFSPADAPLLLDVARSLVRDGLVDLAEPAECPGGAAHSAAAASLSLAAE
jgi:hypothetical protein